jgi:SlyX protein
MTETEILAERIDGLEIRIAHQDHTIEELSSTIADQWKQIEDLTFRLTRLNEQMRDFENSTGAPEGPEPPPPHY